METNVTNKLPNELNVLNVGEVMFVREVEYEWLPIYSGKCAKVDHYCKEESSGIVQKWIPKNPLTPKVIPRVVHVTPEAPIPIFTSDNELRRELVEKTWKNSSDRGQNIVQKSKIALFQNVKYEESSNVEEWLLYLNH